MSERSTIDPALQGHPDSLFSAKYRWYVVILLAVAYTFYTADRILLGVLVEPIKEDFHASDSRMGLISFLAAASYALSVIPMGLLADRTNRKRMLSLILLGWSLLTTLSGFARNALQLTVAQMLVAVNESGGSPTMSSLIADLFERKRRGLPIAVWYCGISLGVFTGYSLGGYLADHFGWRTTFLLLGAPGLVTALLVWLTIRETPRGMADGTQGEHRAASLPAMLKFLKTQSALRHAIFAQGLSGLAFIGPIYWLVSFLVRTYHTSFGEAGGVVGVIFLITGLASGPLGGVIMERLGLRDVSWHGRMCALMMLVGGVAFVAIYLSPTVMLAFVACFLWQFLTNAVSPINVTVISNLAPAHFRALSVAMGFLLFQLMGFGLGAQIIGWVSDALAARGSAPQDALRLACLAVGTLCHVWAALHFFGVARNAETGYREAALAERTGS